MFVRIAFYATLAYRDGGSRHYLLYDLQKEYIISAAGALTKSFMVLGFFMPVGSSIRSELLTVARFPICWSVFCSRHRRPQRIARRYSSYLHCWRFRRCAACYSTRTQAKLQSIREAAIFFTLGSILSAEPFHWRF